MKNGNGQHRDPDWEKLDDDVRAYMSQRTDWQQPHEEAPLQDPREATEFCAVWDAVAINPATRRIIEYINGQPCDPVPELIEIVRAFWEAGKSRAIIPQQVSTVIALCGGQMSRYHNLRNDVVEIWNKLHFDWINSTRQKQDAHAADGVPFAQSVAAFIADARPPEYLIEPMVQRASLYTLTALTSHGKTAILLYMALHIASGRSFAGKYTTRGRVVWLAGENPDDFRQKVVTACHYWDIDPAELDMAILSGAFDLAASVNPTLKMAKADGDAALVVVDTSAAYRVDDSEDDNANSLAWARVLRQLLQLPGKPTVITATHPTKYATHDNLLPRGGSGFLNEVDGNLTAWANEDQTRVTLHWQGKFRGMTFSPIEFEMRPCPHPSWTLRNGDPVTLKLAVPTGQTPQPRRQRGRPGQEKAQLGRQILADLLVTEGKFGTAPNGLPAVPIFRWRTEFYSRACVAEEQQEARKKSFQRAVERLMQENTIAAAQDWVWLTHPEVV